MLKKIKSVSEYILKRFKNKHKLIIQVESTLASGH